MAALAQGSEAMGANQVSGQPGFYDVGAILRFPRFQSLVVATFGLDYLAAMWISVAFHHPSFPYRLHWCRGTCGIGLRIQDIDYLPQPHLVFGKQISKLFLKLNFVLQLLIIFKDSS